ncbi:MAG: hypothetical protein KDB27_19355, partial [Planctomycetales bacterium]|nr:hypothetical protein [Planctomycetales bacterium]
MPNMTGLKIERKNGESAADSSSELLSGLQQRLLRAVTADKDKGSTIAAIAQAVAQTTGATTMVYLSRDETGRWEQAKVLPGSRQPLSADLNNELLAWCDDACRHGSVQINTYGAQFEGIAVTVPILLKGAPPEAFATIYRQATQPVDRLVVVHQLIAAHVALWHVLCDTKRAEF